MKVVYFVPVLIFTLLLFGCTQNQVTQSNNSNLNTQENITHSNVNTQKNIVNLYLVNGDEGNVYLLKYDINKQDVNIEPINLNNAVHLVASSFSKDHIVYSLDDGNLYVYNFTNSANPSVKYYRIEPSTGAVYVADNKIFVLDSGMNLYIYDMNINLIKKLDRIGDSLPICAPPAYCLEPMVLVNDKLYVVDQKSEDHIDQNQGIWYYYLTIVDLKNYHIDHLIKKVDKILDFEYEMLSINKIGENVYLGGVASNGPLSLTSTSGEIIKSIDTESTVEGIRGVGSNIFVKEADVCEVFTKSLQKAYKFECNPSTTISDGNYIYSIIDKNGEFYLDVYNETGLMKELDLNIQNDYGDYHLILG